MDNYIVFTCKRCGYETRDLKEMNKHMAEHLGLSLEDYYEYQQLKSSIKFNEESGIMFDDREHVRKYHTECINKLEELIKKYDIDESVDKMTKNTSLGSVCSELYKYRHYIGKKLYVYVRGVTSDYYNGTIDCTDPSIFEIICTGIVIDGQDVLIRGYHSSSLERDQETWNIERCFINKETAENHMNREIENEAAWITIYR